jgi:hypothetical protein
MTTRGTIMYEALSTMRLMGTLQPGELIARAML